MGTFWTSVLGRLSILMAALVGLSAVAVAPQAAFAQSGALWTEKPLIRGATLDGPLRGDSIQRVAEALTPAVVLVEHESALHNHGPGTKDHRKSGRASGTIVHPSGLVVTNEHVIAAAEIIHVVLYDGRRFPAVVVGKDQATDLALLRMEGAPADLVAAPLGDSETLRPGQWVVAIGNPKKLGNTVTSGIISGTNRTQILVRPELPNQFPRFVQTDVYIDKGSSGGPLLDLQGRVVAINTALYEGRITLAVPVETLKVVLPHLARGVVTRSRLGVSYAAVSYERAEAAGLGVPRGALVESVEAGGPADRGGVMAQDIILQFDGHEIEVGEDLAWFVASTPVGKTARVLVRRGGRDVGLSVTTQLAAPAGTAAVNPTPPPPHAAAAPPPADSKRAPGDPIAAALGIAVSAEGGELVITRVAPDGPGARGGAREGDIVEKAEGQRVTAASELEKLARAAPPGSYFSLVVEREGESYYVPIEVPAQ